MKPWIYATTTIAAAVVLALVMIIFFSTQFSEVLDDSVMVQTDSTQLQTDSIQKPKINHGKEQFVEKSVVEGVITDDVENQYRSEQNGQFLAEYTPDDTLEKLFNNFKQSYRGESIKVTSTSVCRIPDAKSLRWSNPNGEKLTVEFYNNKGEKIKSYTIDSSGVTLPKFNNGLYYWKLINSEFDLLFVGKIIVD